MQHPHYKKNGLTGLFLQDCAQHHLELLNRRQCMFLTELGSLEVLLSCVVKQKGPGQVE